MSRAFWMVVGAVGGIVAYRRGTQAVERARELGPLGTAQVAASATSRLAGRTAHGLGRLQDVKARREGRLVTGTAQEVGTPAEGSALVRAVPDDWVVVPAAPTPVAPAPASPAPGSAPGSPAPPQGDAAGGHSTAGSTPRTVRQRRG